MNKCVYVFIFVICECRTTVYTPFKVCQNREIGSIPLKVMSARSKIECATACTSDSSCGSSNFNKKQKRCELFVDNHLSEECSTTGSQSNTTVLKKNRRKCIHGGTWNATNLNCGTCDQGYAGSFCERHIIDCHEGKLNGQSGTVNVLIQPVEAPEPFLVKCLLQIGFTFVSLRGDCGTIGDFNQNWTAYKNGFGNLNCNFFIGLQKMHWLTTQRSTIFQIQAWDTLNIQHMAYYKYFRIGDEASNYDMFYTKYAENTKKKGGDGFGMGSPTASSNGAPFCTPDRDCNYCAQTSASGWWFNTNCAAVNLHTPIGSPLKWPNTRLDPTLVSLTKYVLYLGEQW